MDLFNRFLILPLFSFLIIFVTPDIVLAEAQESTKNEQDHSTAIQNIQCREDRILVSNARGVALCIKESSVERFTKLGWNIVNITIPNEVSVKILNVFERPSSPGAYTVIFKVCTDSQPLRTPQVIASSDIEVRIFNMIKNIDSYSCYNSATLIKSNGPETIIIKVNDSNNQKILDLEQKISKLKADLEKQNFLLTKLINESVVSDKVTVNVQIDEITDKIQHLRMELADTRAEYYNLLYSRYSK